MDFVGDCQKDEVNALEKTLETVFGKDKDNTTALTTKAIKDESLEKVQPKNPLLLIPVIRCVLKFLNIEEIKNCRFVSREWGFLGKLALANLSKILVFSSVGRRAADFNSCFLDSTSLFSAFDIREPWCNEELKIFFGEQQKYLKQLTIEIGNLWYKQSAENTGICSWISKSPMVQKDVKYLTKLSIESYYEMLDILPLHLIAHIKDLSLSNCRINLEAGIKICSTKLKLKNAKFYVEGFQLDCVPLNDIVDLSRAKEVSLRCRGYFDIEDVPTEYVVDLSGSTTLDSLTLSDCCDILNGKTSQWVINHLVTTYIPYSLHSQMEIKELTLSHAGPIDLFTLPTSIQKLALYLESDVTPSISCSQPTVFPNLQYLQIVGNGTPAGTDCEFLSHFVNSPQLTHLKLNRCGRMEMKSLWMPKTLKTLILEYSIMKWIDDSTFNLEKLVYHGLCTSTYELSTAKILVDGFDLLMHHSDMVVDKYLVNVLEYRKNFNFRHRLYIGKLRWDNESLGESLLKEYVGVKSSFYVFENGEKGRALSETEFLLFIPQHLYIPPY